MAFGSVYRVDIKALKSTGLSINLTIHQSDLRLLAATIDGKMVAPQAIDSTNYTLRQISAVTDLSGLSLYLEGPDGMAGNRIAVGLKSGDKESEYDPPLILVDGLIINVTDSLRQGIVGAQDTHRVSFDLTTAPIGIKGEVWINFGTGFDVGGISWATYADTDPANDLLPPSIALIDVIAQTVRIRLDDGIPADSGRIALTFGLVHNDTVADDHHVTVMTMDSLENIVNAPVSSMPFSIYPGPVEQISINPSNNFTMVSDSTTTFSTVGYDEYNNLITGLVYTWGITVDSCGVISNGLFRSRKTGTCRITVSTSGISDTSGLITIVPGALRRFTISGVPSSRTAGASFTNPVVVTAYDVNDNVKNNYNGSVYFQSTDSAATLPYLSGSPYQYQVSDSGRHSFSGIGFILRRAGNQTITVTDGARSITSSAIAVQPGLINAFTLSANTNQTSGLPFSLDVTNAVDNWSNLASGSVTISSTFGGGVSPNGVPPVLNNIAVNSGSGLASQTLTNATRTVLRGVAGGAQAYTDTIRLLPGVVGHLRLTNYPSSLMAGQAFNSPANDPRVTVYDIYGNLKANYTDTVFFSATDPLATLPGPYRFVSSDSGIHSFGGSGFIFRTAGHNKLIVSRGALVDTSSAIQVSAAAINSFSLSAPDSITAGISFNLSVSGAIDAFNNSVSGLIVISDSSGAGASPNGTPPMLNNIVVNNGSGTADQILTRTGTARLKGVFGGSLVRGTNQIHISPGRLGELSMSVSSPQVSGSALVGPSLLIAGDDFGNIKTNFSAANDSVVIGCSPSGPMANNILRGSDDFSGGTADLGSLNIIYQGQGGPIRFNAISQSGITGLSNSVDIVSLRATNVTLDNPQVARLDTAHGWARFVNLGGVPIAITAIGLYDSEGRQFASSFTPALPASVPGGADTAFAFAFEVPSGISQGQHPISMKITGSYSGLLTSDSLAAFTDTLVVMTSSRLEYLDGTIAPETLSTGGTYQFGLDMANSGGARINIADSSYLTFNDGAHTIRTNLAEAYYINAGGQTHLTFENITLPSSFIPGAYTPKFHFFGSELNSFAVDSLTITDNIRVQLKSSIYYVSGSIAPETLLAGSPIRFRARFSNNGQAALNINQNATGLSFNDGSHQYVASLDTTSSVRVNRFLAGDTTLSFAITTLPGAFVPGAYRPNVHIEGIQNLQSYQADLNTDSIRVLTPGQVRLDSLYMVSFNAPMVNISQAFRIHGFIRNLGIEPVDSIKIRLLSDGNSAFGETLMIASLPGLSGTAFDYNIAATAVPEPSEIFHSLIAAATNHISGQPALIASPLDNSAVVVIERPAQFAIDTLYVSDESLSTQQQFYIYARANHTGSNSYSGSNQVSLDFSGDSGFTFADSANRDFISGQLLSWRALAPATERVSRLVNVRFNGRYVDLNDSSTAFGADSLRSAAIVVTNRASISHHAAIISPDGARDRILSTQQAFVIADTIWGSGNAGQRFGRLTIPSGFNSLDPVVQAINGGQAVVWRMTAPSTVIIDSLRLDCWTFDRNTGDSVFAAGQWLRLQVVAKAVLSIGAEITAPPSAMDRIIEPGGYFTVRAISDNLGQAGAGSGQMRILFADNRFITDEDSVRNFNPGESVEWTVHTPNEQILEGTQVAVVVSSAPIDSNSNLPASIVNDSSGFTVILKNELPHLIMRNGTSLGGAAVKGQPLSIYRFTLHNSIDLANNQIAFISFGYRIYSGGAIVNPTQVITSSTLDISGVVFDGVLTDSNITFVLNPHTPPDIVIEPDSSIEVTLNIVMAAQSAVNQFRIGFNSDDLKAKVMIGGILEQFVRIVLPDGQNFNVESKAWSVMASDFISSIGLNQNPYLAADGNLEIGYNLTGDASLEFTIYNIEGARVWQKHVEAATGPHYNTDALAWDGRTDSGERALSGIYYLIVADLGSGQKAKIKIALIW
jgi:hypothetical protein